MWVTYICLSCFFLHTCLFLIVCVSLWLLMCLCVCVCMCVCVCVCMCVCVCVCVCVHVCVFMNLLCEVFGMTFHRACEIDIFVRWMFPWPHNANLANSVRKSLVTRWQRYLNNLIKPLLSQLAHTFCVCIFGSDFCRLGQRVNERGCPYDLSSDWLTGSSCASHPM